MGLKTIFNDLFAQTDDGENTTVVQSSNDTKPVKTAENTEKPEPVRTRPTPAAAPAPAASVGALELKICKPQSFAEVGAIADHLMNRCTVVLNLETTSKETARRIVDFLNGVAYSIDGQIKPVANNTFVITPKTVSVSGEEAQEEVMEEEVSDDSSFDNF